MFQLQMVQVDGLGNLQGASAVNTILNGFTVSEEGNVVGTAGSITQLDFRGVNILATVVQQPNGIATITMSETPTFEQINITGITTLVDKLVLVVLKEF